MAKIIKTDRQYKEALRRLHKLILMDINKNTPEAKKLESLTQVLHAYEEKHYPIPPPDPIDGDQIP